MQGHGSGAISTFGSDALKKKYLPAVAAGEKIAAFALSEENAGSDVVAMTTSLKKTPDGYLANGEKTWISNGGIADFYTLFARTGEGTKGVTAVVIDANVRGFSIAERIDVIAPHPLARLRFNDCAIPADHLIGAEGDGLKIALGTLDIFRTTVGAAALGLARCALDEATKRATTRQMFGATLADQPIAQGLLAEMALDVDAAALLIYRSAWTKDVKKSRVTREAAMAKLFATDEAQSVIDEVYGILVVGGIDRFEYGPNDQIFVGLKVVNASDHSISIPDVGVECAGYSMVEVWSRQDSCWTSPPCCFCISEPTLPYPPGVTWLKRECAPFGWQPEDDGTWRQKSGTVTFQNPWDTGIDFPLTVAFRRLPVLPVEPSSWTILKSLYK